MGSLRIRWSRRLRMCWLKVLANWGSCCGSRERTRILATTLLRSGCDLLHVNRLLRRIEFGLQRHMRGGEVSNGFRIFYNPDCLIIVCYKDGPLGFPFRVAHRRTPAPAFLHAIRASGLRVLSSATLIADPTGTRFFNLLRRN